MLGLQVCCYIAPRGCAVHSGLASCSQRPKVLWVVTGREASKWGTFPLFTVLVVWKPLEGSLVPCPVPPEVREPSRSTGRHLTSRPVQPYAGGNTGAGFLALTTSEER